MMMIGTHRDWEYLMPGNGTQIDWTRLVQPLISLCVSVCQRISRYGPQIPRAADTDTDTMDIRGY